MKQIIAVDFDGTLTKQAKHNDWPEPREDVIEWVRKRYYEDNAIIIYTAKPKQYREETKLWLEKHNVPYHSLNMDKMSADIYLDDKSFRYEDFIKFKK